VFVKLKNSKGIVNLALIESIGIEQKYKDRYEVRAWNTRDESYVLATFDNEKEAERYIEMIYREYNLLWRGR